MNVFEFDQYPEFLRSYIRELPKRGHGEVSRIAQFLGVHTTLVSQVLRGHKDFTLDQMHAVTEYLALSELEADYMLLMLQINRAGNQRYKSYLRKKQKRMQEESLQLVKRLRRDRILSETEKAIFYSSWQYSAVLLSTSIKGLQDPDSISAYLSLPRERVIDVLKFLVDCGLVVSEGGSFHLGPQVTHLEKDSPFVARNHLNWRLRAQNRADNLTNSELMFTAPISLSRQDYQVVREKIIELIQQISKVVKESDAEELAYLNIDWLRLHP